MQEYKFELGWREIHENMMKVGDRARWMMPKAGDDNGPQFEQEGTIKSLHGGYGIVVEFDEAFRGGHTGRGFSKDGHGWACSSHELTVYTRGLFPVVHETP